MECLLQSLTCNDNTQRNESETRYKKLVRQDPEAVVTGLMKVLESSTENSLRTCAIVLLRRLMDIHSAGVYEKLQQATRNSVRSSLLNLLAKEEDTSIRHKLGHAIAEVALAAHSLKDPWNLLLPFLSELIDSTKYSHLQETGFQLIAKLVEYIGETLLLYKDTIFNVFMKALSSSVKNVQVASLKAAASYVLILQDPQDLLAYNTTIPYMLRVMEDVLLADEALDLREILAILIQVAELHVKFFRPSLEEIGIAMLHIMDLQDQAPETRDLALEFIITICENAGGMVRKSEFLISNLIPAIFSLICEIDENAEWEKQFDCLDTFANGLEEDNIMSEAGAAALSRLSIALGGNCILPKALTIIHNYIQSSDWKQQYAALYGIALLGEGAKQTMIPELDSIVRMIIPFLMHSHARVQYAAIYCIGQLTNDFGVVSTRDSENFQAHFHALLLPALIQVLQAPIISRNRALTCNVIINFCNPASCKSKHMHPYAQPLLQALFQIIQNCPRQVQEQAFTAVASVAKVLDQHFSDYYDIFIPMAKSVLMHSSGPEFGLLRGKAMETIALIGNAVGKERFLTDAKQVLEILLQVQKDDSLQGLEVQYIAQSCVRIGSILGQDFLPYLEHVVPPLLSQAQKTIDISESYTDTNEEEDDIYIPIQDESEKRICINTSALEEKTNACNMLYQCAMDLKGGFAPYIEQTASIFIPMIQFSYVEDVRIVSALAMCRLLDAAVDAVLRLNHSATFPQTLLESYFPSLLEALQSEDDLECIGAMAEAVSTTLETCRDAQKAGIPVGVAKDHLSFVVANLRNIATSSILRCIAQVEENDQNEDFDDEEARKQNLESHVEEGIFSCMIDAIGYLIKVEKEAFMPLFQEQLLSFAMEYVQACQLGFIRSQILCMLIDILEHCGTSADEYAQRFFSLMIQAMDDAYPPIVQAAAYGIGACAEKRTLVFATCADEAMQKLLRVITVSGERLAHSDDTQIRAARDNAISAMYKVLVNFPNTQERKQLFSMLTSWLPLHADIVEARDVHDRFLQSLARQDSDMLGRQFANAAQIYRIFATFIELEQDSDAETSILSEAAKSQLLTVQSLSHKQQKLLDTYLPRQMA